MNIENGSTSSEDSPWKPTLGTKEMSCLKKVLETSANEGIEQHKTLMAHLISSQQPLTEKQVEEFYNSNLKEIVTAFDSTFHSILVTEDEDLIDALEQTKINMTERIDKKLETFISKYHNSIEAVSNQIKTMTNATEMDYSNKLDQLNLRKMTLDEVQSEGERLKAKAIKDFEKLIHNLKSRGDWMKIELITKLDEKLKEIMEDAEIKALQQPAPNSHFEILGTLETITKLKTDAATLGKEQKQVREDYLQLKGSLNEGTVITKKSLDQILQKQNHHEQLLKSHIERSEEFHQKIWDYLQKSTGDSLASNQPPKNGLIQKPVELKRREQLNISNARALPNSKTSAMQTTIKKIQLSIPPVSDFPDSVANNATGKKYATSKKLTIVKDPAVQVKPIKTDNSAELKSLNPKVNEKDPARRNTMPSKTATSSRSAMNVSSTTVKKFSTTPITTNGRAPVVPPSKFMDSGMSKSLNKLSPSEETLIKARKSQDLSQLREEINTPGDILEVPPKNGAGQNELRDERLQSSQVDSSIVERDGGN